MRSNGGLARSQRLAFAGVSLSVSVQELGLLSLTASESGTFRKLFLFLTVAAAKGGAVEYGDSNVDAEGQ